MTETTTPRDRWARLEREADQRAERAGTPPIVLSIESALGGEWQRLAACVGQDPELFHSTSDGDVSSALAICARCPVIQPCRTMRYAYRASGVWGGVNYAAVSGAAVARRKCALTRCTGGIRSSSPYCSYACEHKAKAGTRSGYDLHIREKTKPCQHCSAARGPYRRAGAIAS